MSYNIGEIATHVCGEVVGDASLQIREVTSIENAHAGCLVYAENTSYFQKAQASQASCIIASKGQHSRTKAHNPEGKAAACRRGSAS